MAYEAYVSLVVIPEEARHRAPWDSQRPANGTTYTQNTSGVSRDDSVLLWASIWLAVRDRDSVGVRAPDLEVQQPGDAFLL